MEVINSLSDGMRNSCDLRLNNRIVKHTWALGAKWLLAVHLRLVLWGDALQSAASFDESSLQVFTEDEPDIDVCEAKWFKTKTE